MAYNLWDDDNYSFPANRNLPAYKFNLPEVSLTPRQVSRHLDSQRHMTLLDNTAQKAFGQSSQWIKDRYAGENYFRLSAEITSRERRICGHSETISARLEVIIR